MADASPTKWHLAHTSWFFETFILSPAGAPVYDPDFSYLFNSYYEGVGKRHPRPLRGLLSRPSCSQILAYRSHVDAEVERLLRQDRLDGPGRQALVLGLAHEEQHQELILMDILSLFAQSPLSPAYSARPTLLRRMAPLELDFVDFEGGIAPIGHEGPGFAFDNEAPRHQVLIPPFQVAERLTTNAEWLEFMQDGGYGRPELWLADGWTTIKTNGWDRPLYWRDEAGETGWGSLTLAGQNPLDPAAPVSHVSFYEADAYARWRNARLPTEAEWEHAAMALPISGNFLESGVLAPMGVAGSAGLSQMYGDLWEWTASPYVAYPGFRPAAGSLGEYNGKFMINQVVLRGGSFATPADHIRATYRNFFQPHQRWMFSGVRLARDVG